MKKKLSLSSFILTIFFLPYLFLNAKTIYLISAPRSYSTVLLRHFDARNDLAVFNEPSQWASNKIFYPETQNWFTSKAAESFDEVKEKILSNGNQKINFVKEMSFAVKDFMILDKNFSSNPNIHFVFLVRDPKDIGISLYQIQKDNFLDSLQDLIGTKDLWDCFLIAKKYSPNHISIIYSHELLKNPKKTLSDFCQQVNIPWSDQYLSWSSLGEDFNGKSWNEIKNKTQMYRWHANAIRSTHFLSPHLQKDFTSISNLKHRNIVQNAVEFNALYYNNFRSKKEEDL